MLVSKWQLLQFKRNFDKVKGDGYRSMADFAQILVLQSDICTRVEILSQSEMRGKCLRSHLR